MFFYLSDQQNTFSYNGGHHSVYNEYDTNNLPRTYAAQDSYSNSYYGSTLTGKQNGMDRDFGLYLEPQPFYQCYGSNALYPYNMAQIPDYVNPNAVLSVHYNSKTNHGGTPYDEQINIISSQQQPTSSGDGLSKPD